MNGAVSKAINDADPAGPSGQSPEDEANGHENHHHHHHHFHHREHVDDDDIDSSDYTTDGSEIDEEEHHLDDVVEHLDVIDPQVATVSHLSNAANSILIPRLPIYSRRPIVTLPTLTPTDTLDSLALATELEEGTAEKKRFGRKKKRPRTKNELDAHVEHVLKRRAKFRRSMQGLGQFLKTRMSFSLPAPKCP